MAEKQAYFTGKKIFRPLELTSLRIHGRLHCGRVKFSRLTHNTLVVHLLGFLYIFTSNASKWIKVYSDLYMYKVFKFFICISLWMFCVYSYTKDRAMSWWALLPPRDRPPLHIPLSGWQVQEQHAWSHWRSLHFMSIWAFLQQTGNGSAFTLPSGGT